MRGWSTACLLLFAIPHLLAYPILKRSLYTPENHLQVILSIRQDVTIDPRDQAPIQQPSEPSPSPSPAAPHVAPSSGGTSPGVFVVLGLILAGAIIAIGFFLLRCIRARHTAPSAEFASPSSQAAFKTFWLPWNTKPVPSRSKRWEQPGRAPSSFSRDMTISQIRGPPIVTAPPQSAIFNPPPTVRIQEPPPPPRRDGRLPQPPVGENPFTDRNAVTQPQPPPVDPPRQPPPVAPPIGYGSQQHAIVRAPPPPPPPPPVITLATPAAVTRPAPPTASRNEPIPEPVRAPSPAGPTSSSTPSHTDTSRSTTPQPTRPDPSLTRSGTATSTLRGARPMPQTPGAHRPSGPRPILRVNTLPPVDSEPPIAAAPQQPPQPPAIAAQPRVERKEFSIPPVEPVRKPEAPAPKHGKQASLSISSANPASSTPPSHRKQESLSIPNTLGVGLGSGAGSAPIVTPVSPTPQPPVTPTPTYIPFNFRSESPPPASSSSGDKKRAAPVGIASALASALGRADVEVEAPKTVQTIRRGLSAQAQATKKRADVETVKENPSDGERRHDSDDDTRRRPGF